MFVACAAGRGCSDAKSAKAKPSFLVGTSSYLPRIFGCPAGNIISTEGISFMFHHSGKLQYQVRVDRPDPQFAKYLQQAIGGVEGEKRWKTRG